MQNSLFHAIGERSSCTTGGRTNVSSIINYIRNLFRPVLNKLYNL